MRHESEPSVEEILESIKKVIARDNRDAAAAECKPAEAANFMVAPDPADEEEAEEILDLGLAASEMAEELAEGAGEDEALTTDRAADAMRQSLAALAMLSEPPARPQIVRSGETSLEGLVREMLRPMLAQWLDAHLPDMVEKLVKAEIARIAGKQR